jgi:hypothetical protein
MVFGSHSMLLVWRLCPQELEAEHEALLSKAKAALDAAGITVSESTEVEAVATVLTPEAGWDIDDVVAVHSGLIAASEREAKEAARAREKREDRFLSLLKDYAKDKEITVDDSWGESMVALLEGHSAYKAIESDVERARLFGEFKLKLVEKKKSSKKKSSKKSKKKKSSSRKEKRKRDDDSSDDDGNDDEEEEGEVSSDSGDESGGGKRQKRGGSGGGGDAEGGGGALPEDAAALEARRKEILEQLKASGGLVGAITGTTPAAGV